MVQVLLYCQVHAIINIKLGDADADTYNYAQMTALLDRWEHIKKYNHGKHCHDQRKNVSLFVLSVDGMLWREALDVLSQFSRFMAEKME